MKTMRIEEAHSVSEVVAKLVIAERQQFATMLVKMCDHINPKKTAEHRKFKISDEEAANAYVAVAAFCRIAILNLMDLPMPTVVNMPIPPVEPGKEN